ncbi:hypothetical protein PIB30_052959 [Stylosanthes scabra]|uniref:Uncharacterized protein n=1 Tax=Stylosanthes scabra TaxID=79078 RepID=A0ABU6RIW2_9FABA|nr:hypothetical protein [Stylosanthes scabra]
MVKESMLNEEARRRERSLINTSSQSEALVSESRGRTQSRKPRSTDRSESRDVQVNNDGDDLHGDPTPQPEVPDAEVPPDVEEPPAESQLSRSTRERNPSHEYVMSIETGN